MEKNNGIYKIKTSADRLPDKFDKIVLYALTNELINVDIFSRTVITSRYFLTKKVLFNAKAKKRFI